MSELNPNLRTEAAKLDSAALVELWEVDFTPLGGELMRFCNQTNEKGEAVKWQGVDYLAYPIKGDGFELSGEGSSARPTLTVSNLFGLMSYATQKHEHLLGVKITRHLTFATFLDADNFVNGNDKADGTQEAVQHFIVERVSSMTAQMATLELAVPAESDLTKVPKRTMLANVCCWQYRGEGCGYTGKAVAKADDTPTTVNTEDKCSKTLLGCRARFGATAVLPFGGFLAIDKQGR